MFTTIQTLSRSELATLKSGTAVYAALLETPRGRYLEAADAVMNHDGEVGDDVLRAGLFAAPIRPDGDIRLVSDRSARVYIRAGARKKTDERYPNCERVRGNIAVHLRMVDPRMEFDICSKRQGVIRFRNAARHQWNGPGRTKDGHRHGHGYRCERQGRAR